MNILEELHLDNEVVYSTAISVSSYETGSVIAQQSLTGR
jgi:hypothetical protein